METPYRHLTAGHRIVVHTLLQEGKTHRYIANRIGFHRSTISREISRNRGRRGYRFKQAQVMAEIRLAQPRTKKLTPDVIACIEAEIRKQHAPEQISSTMEKHVGTRISHERIYQYIWQNKRDGGDLYVHLRIANGKRNRKRYGKKDYRGRIPGRVDIDRRPTIVDRKNRIGDWEADLISGGRHKGFLVTLVERKTKFTLIGHVFRKSADAVRAEIKRLFRSVLWPVKTITYDNGREFSGHQSINASLGCKSYFAKPYHAWERGLSENTNGLIRQYFPKRTDLRNVTRKEISFVQRRLNNRPRKTLGFKTPNQVFLNAS